MLISTCCLSDPDIVYRVEYWLTSQT